MQQEFKLPDLGENIESGDVVQVLVSEGQTIAPEQAVIELETEKAVVEVPCPFGGKIAKLHVKAGDKVRVGAPVVTVETEAATPPAEQAPARQAQKEEAKREPGPPPAVSAGVPETEAATPKAPVRKAPPKPARKPETPSERPAAPASRPAQRQAVPPGEEAETKPGEPEVVPAGPATRRLARELGVDLSEVAAAHPGERLTEEHVKAYVRDRGEAVPVAAQRAERPPEEPAAAGEAMPAAVEPLPDFSQWGSVERVTLSSLQRKTARHLDLAWQAPHVTQLDEADITALEALRKRHRERGGGKVRLTATAFAIKAVASVLKGNPKFNASLDLGAGELILKRYYHIGVAVDTEAGLIVPVVRDADRKRVLDIAAELEDLAERTRQRKVGLAELQGSTFTVTNLGGIGGTGFTPVINYPEVAILGLARAKEMPRLQNGQMAWRLMLPLCLSYDHRVINGADGARFLRKVAELLEDPEMLLLE